LVDDFCRHANLFCNAEHLGSGLPPGSVGEAVTVAEAAAIGRVTWRDVASVPGDVEEVRW